VTSKSCGIEVLHDPGINKSTACTEAERQALELMGLVREVTETEELGSCSNWGTNSATLTVGRKPGRMYRMRLHSPLLRYGAAVGAVFIAFLLNFVFQHSAGGDHPYYFFSAAILASVLLGGTGPGLLAAALLALASSYLFLEPVGTFRVQSVQSVERLVLFLLESGAIIVVGRLLASASPKKAASPLIRYGGALLFVGLAVALKVTLFPSLRGHLPFRFLNAAVLASAWYGGIGPGLLAAVASIFAGSWFFLASPDAPWIVDVRGTLFGLEATLLCLLVASKRQAYREIENRLKRLFAESPVGILLAGPDMRILLANPAVCHLLGYDEPALRELELPAILHPDSRECFTANYQSLSQRTLPSIRMEEQFFTRTGQSGWALFRGSFIDDAAGCPPACLLLVEDMTQRRQTEQTLRENESRLGQAEKMEAIGLLAAGVAHDFNNLLAVMLGYSEQILARTGEDELLRQDAEAISEAARRATDLTGQLLAFSRRQPRNVQLLDLSAVVRGMTGLLRGLLAPNIELATTLVPELDQVRADRSQIEQILVNLATNARDATPHRGRVTIQTTIAEVRDQETAIPNIPPGRYVVLSFSDTGQGMDKATVAHIFEPFFTTKERGRGTGLGLASVYGIVKQCDGYITVDSEPDRGTSFTICLPSAGAAVGGLAPGDKTERKSN
jgi:PAS domain S-box-containing protein